MKSCLFKALAFIIKTIPLITEDIMHEGHLLADIGMAIIVAAGIGIPAFYLKFPLILAYLIAGVILGPSMGFGFIKSAESISTLSEIGLVLLMYILGLEIDIRKLLQAGKAVLVNGVVQFLGCALLGSVFFSTLGFSKFELVYLAMACSLSSTLIVVKILSDQMDLDTLPSRITLGILVIQDLWAIAFLAIQPNLTDLNAMALLLSFSKVGLLIISSVLLAKFLLPKIFHFVARQPELMLIVAMGWCFAMCGVAKYLGLSLEMGALVAGVCIASYPYHYDVAAKISSLRDFFLTLFFVGLGLQIPLPNKEILLLALSIVLFALLSRILIIFPVMHMMKYGNRTSLLPAVNLSQISEFAVVLGSIGVVYKHIDASILSAFIIAMVITALASSFIIPNSHKIFKKMNPLLEKLGFRDSITFKDEGTDKSEHYPEIVILGFFREASSLLFELQAKYSPEALEKFLIVDFNPEAHKKLKSMGIHCKYGDVGNIDTLNHLHLDQAKVIISTLPDYILKGISNAKLLKFLRQLAPQAKIITTSERIDQALTMYDCGASYVSLPRIRTAKHLVDVLESIAQEDCHDFIKLEVEALKERKEVIA